MQHVLDIMLNMEVKINIFFFIKNEMFFVYWIDTRKRLIGLHGILVGCGEILGGGLFGFITKPKTSSQRALMVLIGFILQMIYYYSVFVNIPADATAHETTKKPYFDFR